MAVTWVCVIWVCKLLSECVLGSGRSPSEVSVNAADGGNYTCTASNVFLERGTQRTTRLIVYCKNDQLLVSLECLYQIRTFCDIPLLNDNPCCVYRVFQISSLPKTFWNIFTSVKSFCVKFRKFVDNSYPHISTDFYRFILIFHQMALIFQRVPFVFTLTSFEYSSIKLTQKDLTEVKIFQKVFGVGTSFWNTLYLWSRRSQMRVLYAMMLSICLSVRSFVRSYVACVLWNLLSHSLGGSTWRRASQSAATSEIVIL